MSFIKQVKATTKANKDTRSNLAKALDTVKYEIEQAAENGENELKLKGLQWRGGRYELSEKDATRLIATLRRMKFKVEMDGDDICYGSSARSSYWLVSW